MIRNERRRAMTLIIVLAVMALMAGITAGLVYNAGLLHTQHRHQQIRTMARYATESATAWVIKHADDRTNLPLDGELDIKIEQLLSAGVNGTGTVGCVETDTQPTCDLSIRLHQSRKITRHHKTILLGPVGNSP